MFESLPEDDDILIFRSDLSRYGFPQPATFAKWACIPSSAPCEMPYTLVGRKAAYRVGDLRNLRIRLTYRNTSERTAAKSYME